MRRRLERRYQREEYLTGILASQISNSGMRPTKQPLTPEDFVFTNPPKRIAPAPQSSASMLAAFDTAARLSAVRK